MPSWVAWLIAAVSTTAAAKDTAERRLAVFTFCGDSEVFMLMFF